MARYLYIHIPFCIQKCIYCDFYSLPNSLHLLDKYVDALCKEIEAKKDNINELESIYIGGGTPSILKEKHFNQIMSAIRNCSSIAVEAEITSESNPGSLTDTKIRAMIDAGINRLSIGIQSFNDSELRLLGRMHNAKDAVKAFKAARRGGLDNISLDLIYGLPGQGTDSWESTLKAAIELNPEHISAYELTPEIETPLFELLESGNLVMPDEEVIADMYYNTIDTFGQNGYEHYEISNYAVTGRRCRHNLNYWNRGEYLGIGAGAHSFIGRRRTSNIADVDGYISSITNITTALEEDIEMSDKEALKEIIFLGLRKTEGIELATLPKEGFVLIKEALLELSRQGLIEMSDHYIKLTRKGLLLCNEVIVRLLLCID